VVASSQQRRIPTPAIPRERVPTLTEPGRPSVGSKRGPGRPILTLLAGPAVGEARPVLSDLVLGRGDHVDFRLDEPTVSWSHARIFPRGAELVIEDLASTNGTFVGTERVTAPRVLADGDRIRLGPRVIFKLAYQDALEERAARHLYESAMVDPLTGVHNRRYLDERAVSEFSYSSRSGLPLSVLLVDIDHFKHVNDRCGHAVGDAVLRIVASSMRRVIRPEDVLARYGGEEFVILVRGIDARNVSILAERIRRRIQRLPMPAELEMPGLTVSIGVATADADHRYDSAVQLVAAADGAMYAAKQSGRNRVVAV
jgi:diguanylate cyclase (GGDEF)-like protein